MEYSQTVYLGVDDDIALAIDRLVEANTPEVVMVIPKDAEIFSSIVNLKLLKREADNLSKHLVISTTDKMGRYLAGKSGIELLKERPGAEKLEKKLDDAGFDAIVAPKMKRVSANTRIEMPESRQIEEFLPEKKFATPRSMADIIIPVRHIKPAEKKIKVVEERIEEEIQPAEPVWQASIEEQIEEPVQREPVYSELSPDEYHKPTARSEQFLESWRHETKPYQADEPYQEAVSPREPEFISQEDNLAKPVKTVLRRKILKKATFALIGVSLIVFAFAAYFILPQAKIIITPKKEATASSLAVIADKNITKVDYSLKRIPAQLVKIEKKETKEFSTTGISEGNQKAKGVITVYNNYSASSQGLVVTTRFVAKDSGKLFRTTKTITVPGAKTENGELVPSSIDVEVVADQAGADYNIGASEFTIPGFQGSPKYSGFYGKSKAAMSKGSAGSVKVVSAADIENAKKVLNDELKVDATQALKEQIPGNLKLFDGALKPGDPEISFSQVVGVPAEKFTATVKFQIIALVFDPKYVNDLIAKNNLSSGDKNNIIYNNWKVDFDKGQISMEINVLQNNTGKIDISDLKKKLIGKDEIEIRKVLSQLNEVQSAKITFWPFWVKVMPKQVNKIEIIIEENK